MSDDAPLIFEPVFGRLTPVSNAAKEAMKAINGRVVVKLTKVTRNQRRRNWYWTMLDVVAEVLSDATRTPWDAETLHDDLRDTLGLHDELKTPSGRVVKKRRSTSDRSMNEAERARWTDRVATYLSRQIGIEIHQLIEEVRARGGGDPDDWRQAA